MRDEKISDFLGRLADRVPAPGGGAAAALHAAQAAALLGMVARYSTGEKYAEHKLTIERIITETDELRSTALQLAEDDAAAFTAVTNAYQLPRDTDAAKATRWAAIATALIGAGTPPAEVIAVAQVAVALAEELLPIGNRNVITDIAAATEAARAAATTARVNVEINITGITDEQSRAELAAEADKVDDIAARAEQVTAAKAAELTAAGTPPKLAVVVATADESSAWYVRSIAKAAEKVGITCDIVDLGPDADPGDIRHTLASLCADESVHGVIVQTPLPDGATMEDLTSAIAVTKDIDGANPLSLGRLAAGLPAFAPATAQAVVAILDHHKIELSGRHVAVIGRSTVVGKPAAHLLLDKNATVTVCHSRTKDLAAVTSAADVVVAAVGRAGLVTAEHVRPGAVVVDVGTNPTDDDGLVGDVDAASVTEKAGALTPVPGGVGPVTTALLLQHTVQAAAR